MNNFFSFCVLRLDKKHANKYSSLPHFNFSVSECFLVWNYDVTNKENRSEKKLAQKNKFCQLLEIGVGKK